MTILEINFPKGIKLSSPSPEEIGEKIFGRDFESQKRLGILPPGIHDRTPPQWKLPAFRYIVHSKNDGTGSLELIPEAESSKAWFIDKPEEQMSGMIKPINEHSEPIIIVGGGKEDDGSDSSSIFLYSAIFWAE